MYEQTSTYLYVLAYTCMYHLYTYCMYFAMPQYEPRTYVHVHIRKCMYTYCVIHTLI